MNKTQLFMIQKVQEWLKSGDNKIRYNDLQGVRGDIGWIFQDQKYPDRLFVNLENIGQITSSIVELDPEELDAFYQKTL